MSETPILGTCAKCWAPITGGCIFAGSDRYHIACAPVTEPATEAARLTLAEKIIVASRAEITECHRELGELRARMSTLEGALHRIAEADCNYGDGCPAFGTRHGQCTPCVARAALEGR